VQGLAHTDTGSGPAVVLLHGLTCHLGYWQRVVPLLSGLRVVGLDLRGHGLSAHRDSYAYADYERDLSGLLDELGLDRVVVGGHSLGGYVALLAACSDERIAGVVALDVKSDWTPADAELAERSREGAQRVEPERDALVARLARALAPTELPPSELELLAVRGLERVNDGWRLRWDRRVLATEPVDPFGFLGRVRCPVHVVAGTESAVMSPESARRFAEAIPDATLELAAGAGHHVELDAPALVAERIDRLAQAS
jgi:pimeloyl-ACP methyl ester carboxylesterase